MNGATPMTISATLLTSPRPNTMNRIGSRASGGAIDTAATKGDSVAPASGSKPAASPSSSASAADSPTPSARRNRLAPVSPHSRMAPDRWSGSVASATAVSHSVAGAGSNLSAGLTARRASDPRP